MGPSTASSAAPSADPLGDWLAQNGLSEPAPAGPQTAPSHPAEEIVMTALGLLDVPYQWGGNRAEQGLDCSAFTRLVFQMALGLRLPRTSWEQAQLPWLAEVAWEDVRRGDLVFFDTLRRPFSHVGVFVGDGRFVHAPRAGARVRLENIHQAYWARRFNGARRAVAAPVG